MKITLLAVAAFMVCSISTSAQDWAKQMLEKSPRHGEWVDVKHGDRTVRAFIVYPESKKKTTAVILIHEIFGLTDWVRSMADQVAAEGYIAIAPDLLSGAGPNGGGTESLAGGDGARGAISRLDPDQVTADLNAVADYVKKLPAANGKVTVGGFCWGGGQTFRFATNRADLSAAFVFYGPPPAQFSSIAAPVYGFYGGNDARINASIPAAQEAMTAAGKKYDPVTYEGAGHGFMRSGQDPANTNEANVKGRKEAWDRWMGILKAI